ncbi:MBL fold metallo-hydrolase [Conexibacter sp. DBS9H8]|uniref:MBL fold metallo-hydrolase n=1 Tax=Conexibacter sp. DBS9H8 TaxID=2937801 RepID=UPI00200EBD27|nr:MBL fold metallo-hydrolase [Conexibacter sp. DBS9H8]
MSSSQASGTEYADAAELGIHVIPLDTPFAVGQVNTYLIEDDPLTLVDCGPNTASALTQLERQLEDRGHRLSDLEQIFITHQHLDHSGLAGILAARSGAELVTLDRLAPVLENWAGQAGRSDDDALALMLAHGVEAPVAEALRAVATIIRGYGGAARVDRTVNDGEEIVFTGRRLEVQYRPGHSPSDTVLYDRANRVALLGDHLLAKVSSNALVDSPLPLPSDPARSAAATSDSTTPGPPPRRPEPLLAYRDSLMRTRLLEIDLGLGGHGPPVRDHRPLITGRLSAQERRAEHFLTLLADGPRSAHELAVLRWGRVAITQAFLTLSEVLGHLGLLLADGRVIEDASGAIVRFHAAD